MSTKTDIANLAISNVGIGKTISNLDTERSAEAIACRIYYEICRKAILADAPWAFAAKFATLSLIEENPTTEWNYSYQYPSDCITFLRILSGERLDSSKTEIKYKIVNGVGGKVIYSNQPTAVCEYTENVDSPSKFSPQFRLAFGFRLARYIAPKLMSGDPFKKMEGLRTDYLLEISKAKKQSINEAKIDERSEPEAIKARK